MSSQDRSSNPLYTPRISRRQDGKWTIRLTEPTPIAPAPPMSLQVFIVKNGGLDPSYNRHQWRHELAMIRDAGKAGIMPGLFNRGARKTPEEMAALCCEQGYITESDVDEMLYGLARDVEATLTGERRNRIYGHSGEDFAVHLAYEQWCDQQEDAA